MTDHAHELRRHARKIGHPAGDIPAVMRDAAAHIEDLERRLREAEKDAARWRAARSLEHCNTIWCAIGAGEAGSNLDATIDAAMQPQKNEP